MRQTKNRIHPPYLWSGGRRRLAESVAAAVPEYFGDFVDPALTSGAAAVAVMQARPEAAFRLSSDDAERVNVWRVTETDVSGLVERVAQHVGRSSAHYFAELRQSQSGGDVESAARFVYLCGAAQGGGEAASPDGFRSALFSPRTIAFDEANLRRLSALLRERQVSFTVQGAFDALRGITADDFVFFDALSDARPDARREVASLVKSINAKGAQLLLPAPALVDDREWLGRLEGVSRLEEVPALDAVWVNRVLRRALA
ncbi:hypothetical protein KPL76_09270 [Subtercola sp. PAMC28395]|uniref:hypothetical protein n=1 Tax=Subtercola sp. PAMC28395 TaxID=2846775 RepID=UPI001C0DFD7F|nr:hypothetical protein [Subtercola sp. PAMC28395]QWT22969.1 hypothetical protein KPL76_09270 [Subtercola sp. PAMC28395]